MRVIGGSAGGRVLFTPRGDRVRPTADRVKEAVFSSLLSRFGTFHGLAVLDLFAGTGNLGIESLSRGAEHAVFVDSHQDSARIIGKNIELTGFAASSELVRSDARKALQRFHQQGKLFDIIFLDPPYREIELTEKVLTDLVAYRLTVPAGIIVVETDSRTELKIPAGLELLEKRLYGDTAILFVEIAG